VTKKQRRDFQKQLSKRKSPSTKAAEPVPPAVSAPVTLSLSSEQQRLLTELGALAADINKLIHRATLKMMLDGFKAGSDSSAT
jgi:hypothetical protein